MNPGTDLRAAKADRTRLETRWLELTRTALPALAKPKNWPIRNDHCFQRVILDAVYGQVWYDRVIGRPAYRAMDLVSLNAAVALAEQLVAGDIALEPLNAQSLRWRSERKHRMRDSYGTQSAPPLL